MADAAGPQLRKAFARAAAAAMVLLLCCGRAWALAPDEIALIVNSNEPNGRELAEFYAQARHIPDNRILELSLPTTDDISFEDFERTVVPQVREFLRTGNLEQKVKCFVTFYGVPLRIAPKVNTPSEDEERQALIHEIVNVTGQMPAPVAAVEKMAITFDPTFQAGVGETLEQLIQRTSAATDAINVQLATVPDPKRRDEIIAQMYGAVTPLVGDSAKVNQIGFEGLENPTSQPAALATARDEYRANLQEAAKVEKLRYDATSRAQLRQILHDHFGMFSYVKAMQDQVEYLSTADTGAAFDSELALVEWIIYPHQRWWENPRYYAIKKRPTPPTYMVMRLDAPTPQLVRQIISDSVAVEATGLKGQIVIDGRGMVESKVLPAQRPLATFDQYFRNLADLLRAHSKIQIMQDDKDAVLPAGSAKDVALYCGWYSLHNYVPCCTFNSGAIGYHVASYEMLDIHNGGEPGWVAGLLRSGVAGTLGPVAEPFVGAFPRPDDFFPLLLTGKLSLAEVYWDTEPMTSWMMCMVGDPLYTPYKANPQLQVEDLPDRLKSVFDPAATQPAVP